MPITDNQRLQGLITIGDIANAYMDVYDNCILSVAKTPYKNILETLDAELTSGRYRMQPMIKAKWSLQQPIRM